MPTELEQKTWMSRSFLSPLICATLYTVLLALKVLDPTDNSTWWTYVTSDKISVGIFLLFFSGTFTLDQIAKTVIYVVKQYFLEKEKPNEKTS